MEHNAFLNGLARGVYNSLRKHIKSETMSGKLLSSPKILNDFQGLCIIDRCHVVSMCYIYKLIARYVSPPPHHFETPFEKMQHKTRTNVIFGDYTLFYDSNMYYVEIDCMPWSFVERKYIPELVMQLTKLSNVSTMQKHIVILRNIDQLLEPQLNAIKTIIEDVGKDAIFLLTAEKRSYIECRFGSISFVRLCFDTSAFIYNYVLETNPLMICQVDDILSSAHGELVVAAAMISKGVIDKNATLTISRYIRAQVSEMIALSGSCETAKLYAKISDFTNVMLSSDVPFSLLCKALLEPSETTQNHDVVEILARANTDLCLSNKPQFVYESMLYELVQMQRNKMSE